MRQPSYRVSVRRWFRDSHVALPAAAGKGWPFIVARNRVSSAKVPVSENSPYLFAQVVAIRSNR